MRRIARVRGVCGGLALIAGVSFLAVSAATAQIITLQKLADYPLPGDMSRYDYLSFDPTSHRMYIAHLGQGEVHVFDTQSKSLVGTVQGIPGVHGVIAVPELGRVYATATNENTLKVIDAQTLTIVATIPTGSYPDGLAYAANVGKVYVSNERGGSDTVVDATNNEVVATIAVGGEAGNTVFEPVSGLVFVAVQTQNQLVAIDPTTDQPVSVFDTPGCVSPHGLAFDSERQLAFMGCQGNARMAVLDLQTKQITSVQPVGRTPDVLVFDPDLHRVYVAAEDGTVSVFGEEFLEHGAVHLVTAPNAGPNAHSIGLDSETHHIYVPTANILGVVVLREMSIESLPDELDEI